jgi:hypothetical protein
MRRSFLTASTRPCRSLAAPSQCLGVRSKLALCTVAWDGQTRQAGEKVRRGCVSTTTTRRVEKPQPSCAQAAKLKRPEAEHTARRRTPDARTSRVDGYTDGLANQGQGKHGPGSKARTV